MCRVITPSELAIKTDIELSALFQKYAQDVGKSEPGSQEFRNSLTSLENIRRERRCRLSVSHFPALKPPGF
jgi:hypothetical protein